MTLFKSNINGSHLVAQINKNGIKGNGNTVSRSSLVGCGEWPSFCRQESRDSSSLAGAVQKHSKYRSQSHKDHWQREARD